MATQKKPRIEKTIPALAFVRAKAREEVAQFVEYLECPSECLYLKRMRNHKIASHFPFCPKTIAGRIREYSQKIFEMETKGT